MIFLGFLPVIFSTLLLSAHFFRAQNLTLALLSFLFPLVLIFKKKWAAQAMQVLLILSALEWFRTLLDLIAVRNFMGESWTRMAVILGSVALFTGGSALVFSYNQLLRKRYGLEKGIEDAQI